MQRFYSLYEKCWNKKHSAFYFSMFLNDFKLLCELKISFSKWHNEFLKETKNVIIYDVIILVNMNVHLRYQVLMYLKSRDGTEWN